MRGIFWEITARCNLRCSHCYLHEDVVGQSSSAGELNTEQCLAVVDQLDESNVFTVTVLGGEPFIRKDIMTILRHMGEKRFWTTVDTNGTLIDEKTAKNLADFDIRNISISLEGPNPGINDAIRGQDSFEKAFRGMEHLREFGISFCIAMTVCKMNYRHMESMADFSLRQGASSVKFSLYIDFPQNPLSSRLTLTGKEMRAAARAVTDIKSRFPAQYVSANFDSVEPSSSDHAHGGDDRFIRCGLGATQLIILHNGDVIPCVYLRDYVVGNVMKTHLSEIPHLPEFEPIKNLRTLTIDEANEECAACEWRYFCGGGCRGQAYLLQHDLLAPDPRRCLLFRGDSSSEELV
jgi:radical SAM protein with 4Fe4S-binding SPASM domain